MTGSADVFAGQAEALMGTPFRLHGRSEAGLDCVGLVALALARTGIIGGAPAGYGLRNSDVDRHLAFAQRNGFRCVEAPIVRGDLLLTVPGASQYHLLVALGTARFVHAHAGLGRVALHESRLAEPVLRHWRLTATT